MKQFSIKYNTRSLLIVLIAFIGNAQLFGVDLVLMLLPIAFFLQFCESRMIPSKLTIPLFIMMVLLLIAALRAPLIGIPYFDAYPLWPVKAICLMLLVILCKNIRWPMGNMLALTFICIALFMVGSVQEGRLISVFGPNMLYRIFGLLLLFSVMLFFEKRGSNKLVLAAIIAFALPAVILTGSGGAILVVAVTVTLLVFRISKKLGLGAILVGIFWLVKNGFDINNSTINYNASIVFSRLKYKLDNLDTNTRFFGWEEIITTPFSITGHNYSEFSFLWYVGYKYPHNLFVELYGFYGLIGVILICIVIISNIKSFSRIINGDILSMSLLVLTIGSMFSGDLSDNYGVIVLACALFVLSRLRTYKSFPMSKQSPSMKIP